MNIEEYIETLSKEEKETFKELIDECLEREKNLNKLEIKNNLENFVEKFNKVSKNINKLTEVAKNLTDESNKLLLNSMKDNKVH